VIVSEETAKRIAEALERLADAVNRARNPSLNAT